MSGITVGRVGDELVAVKRADPDDPGRRRAEAELLARLDHPGIVHLVAFVDGESAELRTRYVGTDTWARTPPSTDGAILDGLATVASTVADLHHAGTCHGALSAEHVVIGADRRPILCGLADARPLDSTTELDDMVGLAGLADLLSISAGDQLRADLQHLARRAEAGELSARLLAEELRSITNADHELPGRRSRRARALAAVAVIAATAAIVAGSRLRSDPDAATAPVAAETATPSTTTDVPTTAVPSTTVPSTGGVPPATAPTTAAPPGTTTPAGVEVVHAGRRYGLGAPGDIVVLGDWDCDGSATPALLRVADHTVAVFDRWPEPDASVAAETVGVVPEAIGLEAVDEDGCHRLRVIEPTGTTYFSAEA